MRILGRDDIVMDNLAYFLDWFAKQGIRSIVPRNMHLVPTSSGQVQIVCGQLRGTLPFLRAVYKMPDAAESSAFLPLWKRETWLPLTAEITEKEAGAHDGSEALADLTSDEHAPRSSTSSIADNKYQYRFFRADQILDLIDSYFPWKDDLRLFSTAVIRTFGAWFVPLETILLDRNVLIAPRVETVYFCPRSDRRNLFSRSIQLFPDSIRSHCPLGLDPVFTPENARSGLTRYLGRGWEIGDNGQLLGSESASRWSSANELIPCRSHNAPRRQMLGVSLQARAVPLQEYDVPVDSDPEVVWMPPGRKLLAAFSTCDGWTHEDAFVVSQRAADKLAFSQPLLQHVLVPVSATEVDVAPIGPVPRGAKMVKARADLFALGLRKHEAEDFGALLGWYELDLPGSAAREDVILTSVERLELQSARYRELVTLRLEKRRRLQVGDKLATRHGIKGVVSRILPEEMMPQVDGGSRAEIVLSPLGALRRIALGQFREAANGIDLDCLPRHGIIFVMRQPQDAAAPARFRIAGSDPHGTRGQRYGEMEFMALVAHGATAVAKELLSIHRAQSNWMRREQQCAAGNHRQLSTRALNRFLSTAGLQLREGRLEVPERSDQLAWKVSPRFDVREFPIPASPRQPETLELLEDNEWFVAAGGCGRLVLPIPITASLSIDNERSCSVTVTDVTVIPPWLRPAIDDIPNPLTRLYRSIIDSLSRRDSHAQGRELPRLISFLISMALGQKRGAGKFLRRQVLGRRLTRSARAVIVPDPTLRIDQIGLPNKVSEEIFSGLDGHQRRLVLVNRNPTLQRRGLLAMRPVMSSSDDAVFRLPVGVLKTLAADFDGDQLTVVALESEPALAEAERLLVPGCAALRSDPFRPGQPAFPLVHEMSWPERECELATRTGGTSIDWCEAHAELVRLKLVELGNGWNSEYGQSMEKLPEQDDIRRFWYGLDEESEWFPRAEREMAHICSSVRKKGLYGGILRRQYYRRRFVNGEDFRQAVDALHAVTEPLMQSALSVKRGKGAFHFPVEKFFQNPATNRDNLATIDPKSDSPDASKTSRYDESRLCEALGLSVEPSGLLRWLAMPAMRTLLELVTAADGSATDPQDPRIASYLD